MHQALRENLPIVAVLIFIALVILGIAGAAFYQQTRSLLETEATQEMHAASSTQ